MSGLQERIFSASAAWALGPPTPQEGSVLNFSPFEKDYWLGVGYNGFFRELVNSDYDIYGGSNKRNYNLKSNEGYLNIKLAPLSGVILKPCEENETDKPPEEKKEKEPAENNL